ncbi:sentrin-specific protease 6-like [Pseudoliparis swirei]|uniref:sentrin-specific protease 6-like n=1 Tax=Pseudoliparis swirei TaxID=2059687 RepID=UPI0024BDC863|nr:sentrin-specific protease 6-like [Pseudoliparis swirei]
MAHNRSFFLEALDRSEARRDGGFKHNNWSFSLSGDDGEGRSHDVSVVSVEEMDRQQPPSPEEKKPSSLRHFTSSDPLRTYENRPNNHSRPKRLSDDPFSVAPSSPIPNRTNYFIISPAPAQGLVLQGRHFQHAQTPSGLRKPAQSLDLKERNDFSTTQQAVEVDGIVLTCPDISEDEASPNVKRRLQQKRKPLEDGCSFPLQARAAEVSAGLHYPESNGTRFSFPSA